MKTVIVLKQVYHREQPCIAIPFPKDFNLMSIVKTIPGSKFSATMSCWYVPNRHGLVDEIIAAFKDSAIIDRSAFIKKTSFRQTQTYSAPQQAGDSPDVSNERFGNDSLSRVLHEDHQKLLRLMEQKLRLKGYSANTLKTYLQQFRDFLLFYSDTSAIDLTEAEIRNYLLYLIEQKMVSKSYQNQAINAIKFFYEKIMMQERKVYYLERPLREKRLPKVLSQESLFKIFEALENIKHKLMLMLIYAAGLRRSDNKIEIPGHWTKRSILNFDQISLAGTMDSWDKMIKISDGQRIYSIDGKQLRYDDLEELKIILRDKLK